MNASKVFAVKVEVNKMGGLLDKLKQAGEKAAPFMDKATNVVKEGLDTVTYKNLLDSIVGSCAMVIRSDSDSITDDEKLENEYTSKEDSSGK